MVFSEIGLRGAVLFAKTSSCLSVIGGLTTLDKLREAGRRIGARWQDDIGRIHQIGVDVAGGDGSRFALDVIAVVKNRTLFRLTQTKADDDAMHGGHALAFVAAIGWALEYFFFCTPRSLAWVLSIPIAHPRATII